MLKKTTIYILFISVLSMAMSCSSNDDYIPEEGDGIEGNLDTLAIKPYSYDVTMTGMSLVYHVSGAAEVEVMFREQSVSIWNRAEYNNDDGVVTVELSDLKPRAYYIILIIARNLEGESVTDTQTIRFDYEAVRGTYFMQPFLIWDTPLVNAKKALEDAGNILYSETIIDGEYHLDYRFRYKELKTEYVFNTEQRLKEVLIHFDKERAPVDELRRFISNALGYLAYGNIHVVMNEKEFSFPLYRTSEGSSYVFVYERDANTIVDYISSSSVDLSEKLYK